MDSRGKKILISPLNWGLGHAVRDIPLIHILLKNNYDVLIAGEGKSGILLKKEFPNLQYVDLPSFSIKYPKNSFFFLKLLFQIPAVIRGIKLEHKQAQQIIKEYDIDVIISDNRYGLYSDKIPSIFITHQISLKLPKYLKFFEKLILNIHKSIIRKFDKCFIPDYADNTLNLSGTLSHGFFLPEMYSFIGILSQFQFSEQKIKKYKYDIAIIVSGPEPQRSIFEKTVITQVLKTKKRAVLISGLPDLSFSKQTANLTILSHVSRDNMRYVLLNSEIIISRAGYTTIMDLISLQKKAILIPTPGQTEQEYLAKHLKNKDLFIFKKQHNFNLIESVNELKKLKSDFKIFSNKGCNNFLNSVKSLKVKYNKTN